VYRISLLAIGFSSTFSFIFPFCIVFEHFQSIKKAFSVYILSPFEKAPFYDSLLAYDVAAGSLCGARQWGGGEWGGVGGSTVRYGWDEDWWLGECCLESGGIGGQNGREAG